MSSILYIQQSDLDRCEKAFLAKGAISITGMSPEGIVETLSGHIQSLRKGQSVFRGYPGLVVIRNTENQNRPL